VKSKCHETTDNLKQMSRLTINFNLIYYVNNVNLLQLIMFCLIYGMVNIKNVLSWLKCRHGDVYATDQCHRQ